jgi:hypothetical protein
MALGIMLSFHSLPYKKPYKDLRFSDGIDLAPFLLTKRAKCFGSI